MFFTFPWEDSARFSNLYFHIPFCKKICHYCDFYVAPLKTAKYGYLFQAIHVHLKHSLPYLKSPLKSIYFGGGTPSEAPCSYIGDILDILRDYIDEKTEISLEANPSSIDINKLSLWKKMNINRLSIGIQSLDDVHLKRLGREHSALLALKSVELAQKEFSNINVDLMYGVPQQKEEALVLDIKKLLAQGISHVSAYHLTLKEKHFLYHQLPNDEKARKQIVCLHSYLEKNNWEHYEVSNFSKKNYASQHNQNYWDAGSYMAFGPSAHGFDGKYCRYMLIDDWRKYSKELLKDKRFPLKWKENISKKSRIIEFLFTSLRRKKGLDFKKFNDLFNYDLKEEKKKFFIDAEKQAWGNFSIKGDTWLPSFEGILLADAITLKMI